MSDRPAKETEEIEVTPEMVEKATQMLIESGYLAFDHPEGVRLLVGEILSQCLSSSGRPENQKSDGLPG